MPWAPGTIGNSSRSTSLICKYVATQWHLLLLQMGAGSYLILSRMFGKRLGQYVPPAAPEKASRSGREASKKRRFAGNFQNHKRCLERDLAAKTAKRCLAGNPADETAEKKTRQS